MLLAIDIGNTNAVFALFDGDTLVQSWRRQTQYLSTEDEYASFLAPLLGIFGLNFSDISDVIIGSVVPDARRAMEAFCSAYINGKATYLTRDMIDVEILLDKPNEVGIDRLINAYSVIQAYECPAIVVDFGTATTFDVINQNKQYIGGVIAPGINLSMKALHQAAAKLPPVNIEKPDRVTGTNTVHAMQSGLFYGYIGLIDNILRELIKELNTTHCDVIATGGLAPTFLPHIALMQYLDQDMTIRGLQQIYSDL